MAIIYELEDFTKKNLSKKIRVIPDVEVTTENIDSILPNNDTNKQENIGEVTNCSIAQVMTPTCYIVAMFRINKWKILSKNNYITE